MTNPGVISDAINSFYEIHSEKDVKISIDCKNHSLGCGKNLGEEDLRGFEEHPTLEDRKEELRDELKLVNDLYDKFNTKEDSLHNIENKSDVVFELKQLIKALRCENAPQFMPYFCTFPGIYETIRVWLDS